MKAITFMADGIKIRLGIKKANHDAKKQIKGFCSNPYCLYCSPQKEGKE